MKDNKKVNVNWKKVGKVALISATVIGTGVVGFLLGYNKRINTYDADSLGGIAWNDWDDVHARIEAVKKCYPDDPRVSGIDKAKQVVMLFYPREAWK